MPLPNPSGGSDQFDVVASTDLADADISMAVLVMRDRRATGSMPIVPKGTESDWWQRHDHVAEGRFGVLYASLYAATAPSRKHHCCRSF